MDGVVDGKDFGNWYIHAGQLWAFTEDGDFNHDGAVDGRDFDLWYTAAGSLAQPTLDALGLDRATLSAIAAVPEAGTMGVLAVAGAWLAARRRRRGRRGACAGVGEGDICRPA